MRGDIRTEPPWHTVLLAKLVEALDVLVVDRDHAQAGRKDVKHGPGNDQERFQFQREEGLDRLWHPRIMMGNEEVAEGTEFFTRDLDRLPFADHGLCLLFVPLLAFS